MQGVSLLFAWVEAHLLALALLVARISAFVQVFPAFTRLGLSGLVRSSLALVLALPLVPFAFGDAVAVADVGGLHGMAVALKEAAVGAVFGVFAGLPFWVAEAAGDLVDEQRGSQAALHPSPLGEEQSTPLGTLFVLVLLYLFYAGGGLPLLLDAFFESYRVWPLDRFLPRLDPAGGAALLRLLDRSLRLAILFAAPLLLAMLATELALGLMARNAGQLNVFELALAVKSLVLALMLALSALLLVEQLRDHLFAGLGAQPTLLLPPP